MNAIAKNPALAAALAILAERWPTTSAKSLSLAIRQAERNLARVSDGLDSPAEDIAEEAQDVLAEWREEAAHERETFGEPEDTPCVENCDRWGTGEGRYHGVIG